MSLLINHSNNFFQLAGVLNETNADKLKKVLTKGLKKFDKLIISIEDVESMDRFGVDILSEIHHQAVSDNKSFSIIGYGCKDLYNHFKSEAA
ncbi:hypothetical protein N1F78_08240 [Seonamhaeicola sp. MEBiC1930]|uniref:STAS domain-containing protein n=1 Tax=Seonamhaeicola sp. MEBiC01930 TaxID=2976768 RepID=UPI00324A5606